MINQQLNQSSACSCPCGVSTFEVYTKPLARFYCHCLICQKLYQKPFADFTVMLSNNVTVHNESKIKFDRYRLPPALRRGICISCKQPVIGFLRIAPYVQLAFVASSRYPKCSLLPAPQAHIFYHRRTADINDDLPKYEGYLRSELAVCTGIASGAWGR
jgi:hypothetical protein